MFLKLLIMFIRLHKARFAVVSTASLASSKGTWLGYYSVTKIIMYLCNNNELSQII